MDEHYNYSMLNIDDFICKKSSFLENSFICAQILFHNSTSQNDYFHF